MSIRIDFPGPLTTVQDLGRSGYMKDGFGASGAMDKRALRLGNILVGNEENTAGIEMTLMGISATVLDRTVAAFTGADISPKINGESVPMNKALLLLPGDKIETGFAVSGCRAYLSLRGGVDVPIVMGSRSTNLKCKIGGFKGRKFDMDDIIPVLPTEIPDREETEKRSVPYSPYFENGLAEVRAIEGPQDFMFSEEEKEKFFSSEYKVTPSSDRMGMRLEGSPISSLNGVDIISDGIVEGSVQIPKNGMPIILLSDRQTTGGYAKIATVITADIPLLAQCKPGDSVRFLRVGVDEAQKILKEENKFFSSLRF